jgi:hypothetical protein
LSFAFYLAMATMAAIFLFLFFCAGWFAHHHFASIDSTDHSLITAQVETPSVQRGDSRFVKPTDYQGTDSPLASGVGTPSTKPVTMRPPEPPNTAAGDLSPTRAEQALADAANFRAPEPIVPTQAHNDLRVSDYHDLESGLASTAIELRLHSVLTLGGTTTRAVIATIQGISVAADAIRVRTVIVNGAMWTDTAVAIAQRLGFERDLKRAIARAPRSDRLILQYTHSFPSGTEPELRATGAGSAASDLEWNERWIPKAKTASVTITLDESTTPYRLIISDNAESGAFPTGQFFDGGER